MKPKIIFLALGLVIAILLSALGDTYLAKNVCYYYKNNLMGMFIIRNFWEVVLFFLGFWFAKLIKK